MNPLVVAQIAKTLLAGSNPASIAALSGLVIAIAVARKISQSGSVESIEIPGLKARFRKKDE